MWSVEKFTIMMQAETELFNRTRRLLMIPAQNSKSPLHNGRWWKWWRTSRKCKSVCLMILTYHNLQANTSVSLLYQVPTLTDAFGGNIEIGGRHQRKVKVKRHRPKMKDRLTPTVYWIGTWMLHKSLSLHAKRKRRRLTVKKMHEEAFLQQLAKYDKEVSDDTGGKKGKVWDTTWIEARRRDGIWRWSFESLGWVEQVYLNAATFDSNL